MDTLGLSESLGAGVHFVVHLSESLALSESISADGGLLTYEEGLAESLALGEALTARWTLQAGNDATTIHQCLQICGNDATSIAALCQTTGNDVTTLSHTTDWCWSDAKTTQSTVTTVGSDATSTQMCGRMVPVVSYGGVGPVIGPAQLRTLTTPWASLSGAQVLIFRLAPVVNRGWDWSATIPGRLAFPDPGEDLEIFTLRIGDGRGHVQTSPPLVACNGRDWSYNLSGDVTVLTGTDRTSWILSQPHQSLPTFRNSKFSTIIAAIESATGIKIYGPPQGDLSLCEEDVKQSNWWDALARMAEVAICNLMVQPDGALRFVPLQWVGEPCYFLPESASRRQNPSKRVTGFVISKRTSHHQEKVTPQDRFYTFDSPGYKMQQLRQPVSSANAVDKSTIGSCSLVGFWDGNPNSPTSNLIRFQSMGNAEQAFLTVPQTNVWPATWITVAVAVPAAPFDALPVAARLEISGSSPATVPGTELPDVDLSFTVTVGVTKGAGARPGPVRNESLYPSRAYIIANEDGLLCEANKDFDTATASGPIDCSARLHGKLQMALPVTIPPARIQQVEHTGSDAGFTTSVSGFIIPW